MFRKLKYVVILTLLCSHAMAIDNGRYTIVSALSGLVMDVSGRSTADGANVTQYTANGQTNQQFDVTALGDGSYSIRPVHSGKSLDVYEWNADDGAEVRQWSYLGGTNQRWYINDAGNGYYYITSVFSGKAIDVWEMSTAPGGDIRMYTYWGGNGQLWSFQPVSTASLPNITVWIAGDSTVANGGSSCPIGWGRDFGTYFNSNVTVANRAVGGRSVRTWLYDVLSSMNSSGECDVTLDSSGNPVLQARWQEMLDNMQAGDYLLIQFGINDGASTCPRHVGSSAFKAEYAMMAQAARARGANPVFITPVSAIACSGTTAVATRGFVTETFDVGAQYNVPVIDLHALSINYYNSQGFCPIPGGSDVSASTTGAVGAFFCDDHTHFDAGGALQIGGLVAQGLRNNNIPLSQYLQ